jgi:hypothetical protein
MAALLLLGKWFDFLKGNGIALTASNGRVPGDHAANTFAIRSNEWLYVRNNIFDSANWTAHREPPSKN